MNNINVTEAIKTIKDVGLNVYTPRTKDSRFIKLYKSSVSKILPKISGNSLKVLMALSCELEWNEPEVVLTIEQIIKRTGLERKTVMNCLRELEENFVVKRLGPNVRRSYSISNCYVRIGKNK
ncbi:MarR family transcriptional regulator [Anaplasma marginale]|uniref:MarR family transcriptional regulator n=1 Tax=Anaplasma marginale TaxID=770 RepID=UPI0005B31B58|nr:helix-turn-helix domain-containing protein [Anaplasma marginale]